RGVRARAPRRRHAAPRRLRALVPGPDRRARGQGGRLAAPGGPLPSRPLRGAAALPHLRRPRSLHRRLEAGALRGRAPDGGRDGLAPGPRRVAGAHGRAPPRRPEPRRAPLPPPPARRPAPPAGRRGLVGRPLRRHAPPRALRRRPDPVARQPAAGARLRRVTARAEGRVRRGALSRPAARLPGQLAAHGGPGRVSRVARAVRAGACGRRGVARTRRPAGRPGGGLRRDRGLVAHVAFAQPFGPVLSATLAEACGEAGATFHRGGTYVCIEGPQFSTRAESELYRAWGMDLVGMTNLQEAKLAREAELCYATLAMVTDYDCWHPEHDSVTADQII